MLNKFCIIALLFLYAIPSAAQKRVQADSSARTRYIKISSVGDRFDISTKEPLRFYFDNFNRNDVYFCLLPTASPDVFIVEARAGNKELTELYRESTRDLRNKNNLLNQQLSKISVSNKLNPDDTIAPKHAEYLVKTGLESDIEKGKANKSILNQQKNHVEENLRKLNTEYAANERQMVELRDKILVMTQNNASASDINSVSEQVNNLIQRNRWLAEQRSVLLNEKNNLLGRIETLEMKNIINDLEIEKQKIIIASLTVFSILLLALCYIIYRSYKQKKRLSEMLAQKNDALLKEQEISNSLLLNILPPTIASRLKSGETTLVDYFSRATIVFIDIVNFTNLAASITPRQLLDLLNQIFSDLDALTEKYGLEKIKTIGDAYMVVSGIPNPRQDHAEAAASMAIEARNLFVKYKTPKGEQIQTRIGIATGEAIAGVIGKKKFIYDLWGDSVNTASRMESAGVIGQIQCTEEFYKELSASFKFTKRGEIDVKGKGMMTTYILNDCNSKNGKSINSKI